MSYADTEWENRAQCRDVGAETAEAFFPAPGEVANVALAKSICAACEVRSECLAAAFATGDDHAVRGGMTAEERRATRARKIRTGQRGAA